MKVLVRCRVVQHFGDDLMVVIEHPRGSTKVQIGAGEIVRVGDQGEALNEKARGRGQRGLA